MILHDNCQAAIDECLETKRFAISRLRPEEKTFDLHLHNVHEIYYSISGARNFIIESESYPVEPGDVFFVKRFESHCVTKLDEDNHERITIIVHPDYLQKLSSTETDLTHCFDVSEEEGGHRLSLARDAQQTFRFLIQKLSTISGYGEDLQETATFVELMLLLNKQLQEESAAEPKKPDFAYNERTAEILDYINDNLSENLTLENIANHFYISKSYLCREFSRFTGTSINKYLAARRISVAKRYLAEGETALTASRLAGFKDYSNFHRTFINTLGVTPKKYQTLSQQHVLSQESDEDFPTIKHD